MKKLNFIFFVLLGSFFIACQSESPDRFFGKVVLNTNHIADFSPADFGRRLEQETVEYPNIPSSKKSGNEAQQIVSIKIQSIEKAIQDIKHIRVSDDDAKALKEQSIKLFEKVLPVYQREYTAYAKLCDAKGSITEKQKLLHKIEEEYMPEVNILFDSLYTMGKTYAEKHQLNVKWGN